jgi:hypothetical protein
MPKYKVTEIRMIETIYEYIVEAKSEQEARDEVLDGNVEPTWVQSNYDEEDEPVLLVKDITEKKQ